jgi:hypothetical protein
VVKMFGSCTHLRRGRCCLQPPTLLCSLTKLPAGFLALRGLRIQLLPLLVALLARGRQLLLQGCPGSSLRLGTGALLLKASCRPGRLAT